MPRRQCPYPECTWKTEDVDDISFATLSIQIHAQGAHPVTPPAPAPAPTADGTSSHSREEKVRRPTISSGGTGEDWIYFMARWEEYKAANPAMVGKRAVLQLLECCDDELRKDLTRNAGGSLADRPETEVLAAIKLLAVRQEALMVSRNILWNMQQDHDERIRTFGARLRGQAGMCNLTVKCCKEGCEQINSFMDQIIRDVLICGVSNYEIRLAILQDKNQDMSLEEAFQFIEAKEAGKRSASFMQDTEEIAAARSSQYCRQMKQPHQPPQHNNKQKNDATSGYKEKMVKSVEPC